MISSYWMNDYYLVSLSVTISKIVYRLSCVTNLSDICKVIRVGYPPDYHGNSFMRTCASGIYNELYVLCLKYTSFHKIICVEKLEAILLYDYIFQVHFIFWIFEHFLSH